MKHLLRAGTSLAFALALSGTALADITIATVGPMTGENASTGEQFKNGTSLAVDATNPPGVLVNPHDQDWSNPDLEPSIRRR
jgi:branched-chain amino acid transport system substrate-binding protein